MAREPLSAALSAGRLLLGGGPWGSALQQEGLAKGACADAWNVYHTGTVARVAKAYVAAGAQYLTTNTFQATRPQLERHGRAKAFEAINAAGVRIARAAFGDAHGFVLAVIGPPRPSATFRDVDAMIEQATALTAAGPDALLLETCGDPAMVAAVAVALRAASPLPLIVSYAYVRRGDAYRTCSEATLEEVAGLLPEGLLAWGANCSLRPPELPPLLARLRMLRPELPLLAHPCAGTPVNAPSGWHWPAPAREFGAAVPDLIAAGAQMIGGCCGAGPRHIAAMHAAWPR